MSKQDLPDDVSRAVHALICGFRIVKNEDPKHEGYPTHLKMIMDGPPITLATLDLLKEQDLVKYADGSELAYVVNAPKAIEYLGEFSTDKSLSELLCIQPIPDNVKGSVQNPSKELPPFDPPYRNLENGQLINKEVMNSNVTTITTSVPKEYRVVATGVRLVREPNMFYWRGRNFSGLVDVNKNALYDDPEDSFAAVTGMISSLDQGLIELVTNDSVAD